MRLGLDFVEPAAFVATLDHEQPIIRLKVPGDAADQEPGSFNEPFDFLLKPCRWSRAVGSTRKLDISGAAFIAGLSTHITILIAANLFRDREPPYDSQGLRCFRRGAPHFGGWPLADSVVIWRLSQLAAVDGYPHIELARIPVWILLSGSSLAALLDCGGHKRRGNHE